MSIMRTMYDELMTDLVQRGFGGYVASLHDYKKGKSIKAPTYTDSKTKNKNESPASSLLRDGGDSHSLLEVNI
jgi:hypothetical protein